MFVDCGAPYFPSSVRSDICQISLLTELKIYKHCAPDGAESITPQSSFIGDNVCLDLAVDSAPPEPLADSLRRDVGCFAKPRGIAGLDLIS